MDPTLRLPNILPAFIAGSSWIFKQETFKIIYSTRFEQEEHIYLHEEDHPLPYGAPYSAQHSPHSACSNSQPHSGSISMGTSNNYEPEMLYQVLKIDPEANVKPLFILRRQIFIIRILGLFPDDTTSVVVNRFYKYI